MASILHIETSAKTCSLVLTLDGEPFFRKRSEGDFRHAASLGLFVQEAVEALRRCNRRPDAVAVSEGPGSYTGLRIGVSEAKGLCYGFGIPLIALPTLKIMAASVIASGVEADLFCPMTDARRMEVYAAVYDKDLRPVRSAAADILTKDSFAEYLAMGRVAFFGDGSDKWMDLIESPAALFIPGVVPLAEAMIPLAEEAWREKKFVDTAYFEPFYLKEFQATTPKNKVLGK